MTTESAACRAFWSQFTQSLLLDDPRRMAVPDAFAFGGGGGGALADELLALVLAGRKRATTSLPVEFTSLGEPLPRMHGLSIILDGRGEPAAVIERTAVDLVPFGAVDEAYAAHEGEGDGSLAYWRKAHTWYFNSVLEKMGARLDDGTPVLCQRFRLVWPRPVTAAAPA